MTFFSLNGLLHRESRSGSKGQHFLFFSSDKFPLCCPDRLDDLSSVYTPMALKSWRGMMLSAHNKEEARE